MPVRVVKYRCQFKCGMKAKSKEADAIKHELTCWNNPASKSCTTCKHEVYYKEHDSITDPYPMDIMNEMVRYCKVMDDVEFEDAVYTSQYHSNPVFHKLPARNCKKWEPKTPTPQGEAEQKQ